MQHIRRSRRGNKQMWGYAEEAQTMYIVFGARGRSVALYSYRGVPSELAEQVRHSDYDSQTLSDLVVERPEKYEARKTVSGGRLTARTEGR